MTEKTMNIYEKIMTARLEFLNSNPTKTGYNKFQNFKYFELVDIVPIATKICCKLGLYTHINIADGKAEMFVANTESSNINESVVYQIDAPMVREDKFNTMLQDTGRAETYLRRYLYMLFLDITENDSVDAADQQGNGFKTAKQYKQKTPAKTRERLEAERIIKELEKEDNVDLENARQKLMKVCANKSFGIDVCNDIWKELEVLLNGSNGKADS